MNLSAPRLKIDSSGFTLADSAGRIFLAHSQEFPLLYAGRGESKISMHHGNFDIRDEIRELCALRDFTLETSEKGEIFAATFSDAGRYATRISVRPSEKGRLALDFKGSDGADRFRICLPAWKDERIYGCGEQFSYLDLRGRRFPLWTSEQGVGRNKSTRITLEADLADNAGGDYWWTFFPQPSFVSSMGYWCHVDTSAYAAFDFSRSDRHELYFWEIPQRIVFGTGKADVESEPQAGEEACRDLKAVVEDQSDYFGRQPPMPDWSYDGVILGIQGGTEVCQAKLEKAVAAGLPVAGIWAQDWEGINMTSFGQRLRWDWVWNKERYPALDEAILKWRAQGVRFLAYANCYVGKGWSLCEEAASKGFLVKNSSGEDYYVDFGEFYAGIPDLTNPEAFDWFAEALKKNMIDLGMGGWMADFGEYLPVDAVLWDGTPALIAHNLWPALWAKCNHEAVRKAGAESEVFYFMRAGFTGNQRWCPMMWGGDQNVDWSQDDGLPSAVRGALSLAMSGHGVHHSDIGGYTTLFGMKRTKELLMRWTEQAAFSPLMRTHEGNRPKDNWQFDSDEETLAHLARMGRVHVALKPYLRSIAAENAERGIPMMRPMFLEFSDDKTLCDIDSQYMLGPDILVAPVMVEGADSRPVRLPPGGWVDFWSGDSVKAGGAAGNLVVDAPLGAPPVFVREDSVWRALCAEAAAKA
ncbi:MAG: alpha-glucosidase [Spirochaetae bacterium HGW-Spirochaetae-9]|nr:MAG: alpha-glucosidase [Spirochaetae bacterium HGW-Spirochaetae-9]